MPGLGNNMYTNWLNSISLNDAERFNRYIEQQNMANSWGLMSQPDREDFYQNWFKQQSPINQLEANAVKSGEWGSNQLKGLADSSNTTGSLFDTVKDWTGLGLNILKGVNAFMDWRNGRDMLKYMRDAFNFNKGITIGNFNNQVKSYNTRLANAGTISKAIADDPAASARIDQQTKENSLQPYSG